MAEAMNKSCSIREVARQAQVSPGTVSKVLNNRPGDSHIAEETRQRIMATAQRLNYTPNINAKRLFSRRAGSIGLVVPSFHATGEHVFDDIHLTRIISGLERQLTDCEYTLQLLFSDERFVDKKRYLSLLRENNIDGLLIWGAALNEKYWDELIAAGYPHLFISTLPQTELPANYVANNYEQGGYMAMRHLLELGHRKMAWISGKHWILINQLQEKGITRALAEYGMQFSDLIHLPGDYFTTTGECLTRKLLDEGHEVTAIIAANNQMGAGAVNVAHERGITVPGQLAVAGCNGIREFDDVKHVSCAFVNDYRVGEAAAESMIKLIEEPSQNIKIFIDVEFERRLTT